MPLLQRHAFPPLMASLTPMSAFHTTSPPIPLSYFPGKAHKEISLFSSSTVSKTVAFPLSTPPRKQICRPPRGKHLADDYLVKKKSAAEVQKLVEGERTKPIVIDFYATWCGPCILMAQELETLAVEYDQRAIIVKVDTDEEYEFARDMQVRGLPTLIFISPDPDKGAIRTEGLIPVEMMRKILENEM